jgi:hypothetical protein
MLDVLLDALIDTLKATGVVFILNIVISFIEGKISTKVVKESKLSTLFGSAIGLIPQCGFSIVASDMFIKKKITIGTLVAVFITCSDEALPMMLSQPNKIIYILPLLGIKFIAGFLVGTLLDFILDHVNRPQSFDQVMVNNEEVIQKGCCNHDIEENAKPTKSQLLKEHLLHPFIHSLKIFVYIFIVNIIFGIIIYYVGEDVISDFLTSYYYLTPVLSILVGLIPNCASSVIITELFLQGSLPFGAALAGLICNAGLGLVYLIKNKKNIKDVLIIILTLVITALVFGYGSLLIESFIK